MKFSDGDWIINKNGEKSEIVEVDIKNKEYAFINCLGRKIWLDTEYIDKDHKLSTPRYITSYFDF